MDYLRQTNLLLGEGTNFENGSDLASLENALSLLPPSVPIAPPLEEKKERKKRSHDPNAPKRPLTPYFLYMQTARPIIASDLGPDAAKGAVQEEGQRRWSTMSAHDKAVGSPSSDVATFCRRPSNIAHRVGTKHTSTTCGCTMPASTRTSRAMPMQSS